MQARFEGSLMTSLAELRAIEEERIAQERAAVLAEVVARQQALEDAERRARAEGEAKIAAVRNEEIRIAREREQAERAARLHVESVEATERARLAAALEQERMVQELDLRRQETARKRPTWMVAVTIGAVIAAGALTWFGVDRYQQSQQAIAEKDKADAEAKRAKEDAEVSRVKLAALQGELAELDAKIGKAIDQVIAATNADQREIARQNLQRLREEEAVIKRKKWEEDERIRKKKRNERVEITDECKKNALAKGCM